MPKHCLPFRGDLPQPHRVHSTKWFRPRSGKGCP
jgi:hypothetical protein